MASIQLAQVRKIYPNGQHAVRELTLEVREGELLVLVGPSGSGKSTALRMIAGLEEVSSGEIRIGGRPVTHLPPRDRDLAMVFQSYALYPHLTVRENLGFGLRMRKVPRDRIAERVDLVAGQLGLGELLDRKPAQLSGGQRQRVALGRAIVREPLAFLFDEPLSNLDARLRVETRAELARLHRRLGATMVYVTHDQVEAMTLGDRVAVLHEGELQQVAPPMELYRRPANRFVAEFLGSPGMNIFEGAAIRTGEEIRFRGAGMDLPLGEAEARVRGGEPILLGVRPHETRIGEAATGSAGSAEVLAIEPLGNETVVHLESEDGTRLAAIVRPDAPVALGDRVPVQIPAGAIHLFNAEDGKRM